MMLSKGNYPKTVLFQVVELIVYPRYLMVATEERRAMDPWRSEFGIFLPGSSGGAEILPGKVREVDPATDVGLMRLAGHAVVL